MSLAIDVIRTEKIIKSFIKQRVTESRTKGVVIGLSGGIDSSVVGKLAVDAIGKDKVLGIYLPDSRPNPENEEHVNKLVKFLGCEFSVIPIQGIIDSTLATIGQDPSKEPSLLTLGNLKARIRMNIWYYHANSRNYLSAGGGNKTEVMTGYCTKFGDSAVDIMPIGDLYKTQVRILAKHLKIPGEIIEKPPTAGLWDGQTDEEELGMKYELLDKILARIEYFQDDNEIHEATGASVEDIARVRRLIRISEHKRRPPMLIKLGYRTPGIDWRIPYSNT
ncbi:MAG: NAD+ synthase [Candidatus Hodarchaeales archaeon]